MSSTRARRLVGAVTSLASLGLVGGVVTTAPAAAAPAPASGSASDVPTPEVTPAPAGRPQASQAALTEPKGYVESELFVSGEAHAYTEVGEWTVDGKWQKEVDGDAVPYRTRLIVNRPADPKDFNGTVWVEWLNVSSGADIAPSFTQARGHILDSGAAWVGVSAQRAGVEAAKRSDPRYSTLEIARDALSYDIYSQAGQAVRESAAEVLDGLRPRRVIAAGESQSAFRMTTYVNAFHPLDQVFDGFMVHSRFAPAAPLAGDGFFGATATRIREDVDAPVLQLQTESDLGGWEAVRQPDRGNVHTWEVAGSAHADVYTVESTLGRETDGAGVAWLMGCVKPVNDFPFRYAANAGYAALERWVRWGLRPASVRPLEIVDNVIQRDADGNAKGGLRLPDIDVPVARHSGLDNSAKEGGSFFCPLFGTTTAFTPERLAELYPTHRAYVRAYATRAGIAVLRGTMTWADARAAIAAAKAAPIPG